MCYIKNIFIICILGTALPVLGQLRTQFHFRHLSKEDGFTQGDNTFVYQDSYGLTWISSRDGLNCFNGQTLKVYTSLPDKSITSPFLEDPKGNLWFSTFNAIYCYQRQSDDFKAFQLKDTHLSINNQNYYAFYLDKDSNVWVRIGSQDKSYLYLLNSKNGSFKPLFPLSGDRCYMITDAQGKATQIISTVGQPGSGFFITDVRTGKQQKKELLHYSNGKKSKFPFFTNSAYPEGDSVIWVAVYGGVGVYYPQKDTGWVIIDRNVDKVKIKDNDIGNVLAIVPYTERYLLVSSEEAGLLLLDKQALKFVDQLLYDRDHPFGLKSNNLTDLFRDRSDHLWVTEPGKGLSFTNLYHQKFELLPQMIGKSVTALYEDHHNNIWCSTQDSGLYRLNHERKLLHHASQFDNRTKNPAGTTLPTLSHFVEVRNDDLWAVYNSFLFRWDTKKMIFYLEDAYFLGLSSDINYYFQTNNGQSLVAIGNSIDELTFAGNHFSRRPFLDLQSFQLQKITSFYQDARGYYYIADNYYRLLILYNENGQLKKIKEFTNVGECTGFYEDSTLAKLWVTTTKGLFSINQRRDLTFQPESALPEETFYAVIPDHQGNLWLTGNNGLIRYNPQQQQWLRFSQADGLQSAQFNQNAWLRASNGAIWLGGPDGLNVFHPDSIKINPTFPNILIENIKINDVDYNGSQNVQLMSQLPKLSYLQNTLSFNFLALEYNDPNAIQLKYRLLGQDTTWIETKNPGFVRFSKLPAGAYTLELLTSNANGMWMEPAAAKKLSFYIPVPWWRTWWFYLLCVITIVGIAYSIFIYRLQQALKIERMRVKISTDLHDDVGTQLSGLAMQAEILELTAPEASKSKLQRISEMSRSAMSRMRDTVWAIDARKDKLENLLDRMREHAEETLTPKDILYDLQIDQLALTKNMPSHIRQNLYLIYKEAITNIAKHSNADKVLIKLQKFGNKGLEMRIHDNGKVAQKDYKTTGLGTSNMQLRAEQIGAALQINTDNGFLIIIQLQQLS